MSASGAELQVLQYELCIAIRSVSICNSSGQLNFKRSFVSGLELCRLRFRGNFWKFLETGHPMLHGITVGVPAGGLAAIIDTADEEYPTDQITSLVQTLMILFFQKIAQRLLKMIEALGTRIMEVHISAYVLLTSTCVLGTRSLIHKWGESFILRAICGGRRLQEFF